MHTCSITTGEPPPRHPRPPSGRSYGVSGVWICPSTVSSSAHPTGSARQDMLFFRAWPAHLSLSLPQTVGLVCGFPEREQTDTLTTNAYACKANAAIPFLLIVSYLSFSRSKSNSKSALCVKGLRWPRDGSEQTA
jgi:hypothetical protein